MENAILFSVMVTALIMGAAFLIARLQRWAETPSTTSPTQTDWNEDQLLVVNMLELGEYRKDNALYVSTERTADGKTLVFTVAIWWPLFKRINTQKVTVFNVEPIGRYVNIGGTIEL